MIVEVGRDARAADAGPVLDDQGEPKVGPDGRLLRTEMETVTFSEIVPAGGQG
jgi:hypothetical protein